MKKKLLYLWDKFEELLIFALFLLIMATVTLQIVNREFIGATLLWTEELARFLYIWVAYIGFAYVMKKRKNLRIDVILEYMSPKARNAFSLVEHLITLVVAVWLFVIFVDYIEFTKLTVAPALRFPIRYVYIIFPISQVMLFVRTVVCTIEDAKALFCKKSVKEEEVA